MTPSKKIIEDERARHGIGAGLICKCGKTWAPPRSYHSFSNHRDDAIIAALAKWGDSLSAALDEAGGGAKFAVGDRVRYLYCPGDGIVISHSDTYIVEWLPGASFAGSFTYQGSDLRAAPPKPPTLLEAEKALDAFLRENEGLFGIETTSPVLNWRAAVARERGED